ncbi:MAG TPA: hypothetical protein VG797_05305 [Phycisphaerales bacterium]|nr:hypothetical protein [Phycisphaerales bacterium]
MNRFNARRSVVQMLALAGMVVSSAAGSANAALITEFVAYGKESVSIGVGSSITGLVGSGSGGVGSVGMNGGAGVFGDVRSANTITLANNCFITGNAFNPGSFSTGSGATIGSHTVGMPDLPVFPSASVYSGGVTNSTVANGGTINLLPGSYNTVSLGGAATLNLSSGDYYINSLSSGNGLDLNINITGGVDCRVFVTGAASFGSVDVFMTGGDARDVFVETHAAGNNAFKAGGSSHWVGNVFTPNGEIHIGSGSSSGDSVGYLWAGTEVDIEHGIKVSNPFVPAPGAVVVVGLAGAMGFARRRRG